MTTRAIVARGGGSRRLFLHLLSGFATAGLLGAAPNARAGVCSCPGNMDNSNMVNGADIRCFVACLTAGGSCPDCSCADLNQDNVLGTDDIPPFVALLLVGPSGCSTVVPTFSEAEANSTGPGHAWQGGWVGPLNELLLRDAVNIYSFAKQTEVILAVLRTPGGVTVPVALHHNSMAAYSNPALGPKWNHSLWVFMLPYYEQDNILRMGIYWGNHREQRFIFQNDQWEPLDGYRDALQTTPTNATLTLHDQTRLEFFAGSVAGQPGYQLDRIVDTSGNTIEVDYDIEGRVACATDPHSRRFEFLYTAPGNRLGELRFVVGAWSRSWFFQYSNGRIESIQLPPVTTDAGVQNYTAQFAYDPGSNIVSLTDLEPHEWTYGYDTSPNADRLRYAFMPGNLQESWVFDWIDPLTRRITDPRGVSVELEFDPQVRLAHLLDPLGNPWVRAFANVNYPWAASSITAPSGTTWSYDFDPAGNIVGYTDPASQRWDYSFDTFNNLTQILQPLVTDAWGNTEPARRRTDLVYNAQHLPIEVRRMNEPGFFYVWTLAYSPQGQVAQISNPPGNAVAYAYDLFGNLAQVTSPAGRTFQWLYEDPELTFGFTVPNAVVSGLGQRTELVRDEWGRLRVKDYLIGADDQYAYDGLNHLILHQVGAAPPTNFAYNPAGLLAFQIRDTQSIQIDRLPNGLPSMVTEVGMPMPRTLEYQYGPRNELTTLIDDGATISFAHDADLRLTQRALPNGASTMYAYANGRLASITHRDVSNIAFASAAYAYQANGQRMQADEAAGNLTSTTRYGYDMVNELVHEQRTGAVPYDFEWTYDTAGNRLTQEENGQTTRQYSYDIDNLLQSMTGVDQRQYTWDNAGRLVQRVITDDAGVTTTESFLYVSGGRLFHVNRTVDGGPLMPWRNYVYNALGGRIARGAIDASGLPESDTDYLDLATVPFREEKTSLPGGEQSSFRPTFAGGLVRWLDATTGQCMYPATDADGSVRAWTDNAGTVGPYVSVYDAFGETILDQGPRPPYAFNGDAGTRNDGDFGWLLIGDRVFYSPVEQIIVGAGDAVPFCGSVSDEPPPYGSFRVRDWEWVEGVGGWGPNWRRLGISSHEYWLGRERGWVPIGGSPLTSWTGQSPWNRDWELWRRPDWYGGWAIIRGPGDPEWRNPFLWGDLSREFDPTSPGYRPPPAADTDSEGFPNRPDADW